MKKLSEVLVGIDLDLKMLETTASAVATSDVATGFESAVVVYLQSILENQKVLAAHLANQQIYLRRLGMPEPYFPGARTNVIAGDGGSRGVR